MTKQEDRIIIIASVILILCLYLYWSNINVNYDNEMILVYTHINNELKDNMTTTEKLNLITNTCNAYTTAYSIDCISTLKREIFVPKHDGFFPKYKDR